MEERGITVWIVKTQVSMVPTVIERQFLSKENAKEYYNHMTSNPEVLWCNFIESTLIQTYSQPGEGEKSGAAQHH